jgi:hypothetical protein
MHVNHSTALLNTSHIAGASLLIFGLTAVGTRTGHDLWLAGGRDRSIHGEISMSVASTVFNKT